MQACMDHGDGNCSSLPTSVWDIYLQLALTCTTNCIKVYCNWHIRIVILNCCWCKLWLLQWSKVINFVLCFVHLLSTIYCIFECVLLVSTLGFLPKRAWTPHHTYSLIYLKAAILPGWLSSCNVALVMAICPFELTNYIPKFCLPDTKFGHHWRVTNLFIHSSAAFNELDSVYIVREKRAKWPRFKWYFVYFLDSWM